MKIVGLTGGIGSGKSTIAKMFENLGVPVYFSDDEAKLIMTSSSSVRKKLIAAFGKESFINNELNRAYISNIVFNDKKALLKLNDIVHPKVKEHFYKWVESQNAKYIIQENPLIFENNNQNNFDVIIFVSAPIDIRLARTMSRDNSTAKEIKARMNNQMEDEQKIQKSDFIIENIDLKQSENEVFLIHKEILNY